MATNSSLRTADGREWADENLKGVVKSEVIHADNVILSDCRASDGENVRDQGLNVSHKEPEGRVMRGRRKAQKMDVVSNDEQQPMRTGARKSLQVGGDSAVEESDEKDGNKSSKGRRKRKDVRKVPAVRKSSSGTQKLKQVQQKIIEETDEKPDKQEVKSDGDHVCSICSRKFRSKNLLNRHLRTSTHTYDKSGKKEHRCEICDKTFRYPSLLALHRVQHEEKKPHQCELCDKSFARDTYLRMHMLSHTGERLYKCTECDKTFNDSTRFKDHKRMHTGERAYKCDLCGEEFFFKQNLKYHRLSHTGERAFKCDFAGCTSKFKTKDDLKKHQRTHSTDRPWRCDKCGKAYSEKRYLLRHMRKHTGERPYKCEICGAAYALRNGLLTHRMTHSEERPFQCSFCSKQFKYKNCLNAHLETHTSARPHKCETCGVTYKSRTALLHHRRNHTGKQLYRCNICDQGINTKDNYLSHMAKHTGEKPFTCETCGKTFRSVRSFREHRVVHSAGKQHVCDVCGKQYVFLCQLKKHKLIHREERPFACHCGKAFKTKSNLVCHEKRQHRGSSMFTCSQCGQNFAQQEALTLHVASHGDLPNHTCDICCAAFMSAESLRRHRNKHRKVVPCLDSIPQVDLTQQQQNQQPEMYQPQQHSHQQQQQQHAYQQVCQLHHTQLHHDNYSQPQQHLCTNSGVSSFPSTSSDVNLVEKPPMISSSAVVSELPSNATFPRDITVPQYSSTAKSSILNGPLHLPHTSVPMNSTSSETEANGSLVATLNNSFASEATQLPRTSLLPCDSISRPAQTPGVTQLSVSSQESLSVQDGHLPAAQLLVPPVSLPTTMDYDDSGFLLRPGSSESAPSSHSCAIFPRSAAKNSHLNEAPVSQTSAVAAAPSPSTPLPSFASHFVVGAGLEHKASGSSSNQGVSWNMKQNVCSTTARVSNCGTPMNQCRDMLEGNNGMTDLKGNQEALFETSQGLDTEQQQGRTLQVSGLASSAGQQSGTFQETKQVSNVVLNQDCDRVQYQDSNTAVNDVLNVVQNHGHTTLNQKQNSTTSKIGRSPPVPVHRVSLDQGHSSHTEPCVTSHPNTDVSHSKDGTEANLVFINLDNSSQNLCRSNGDKMGGGDIPRVSERQQPVQACGEDHVDIAVSQPPAGSHSASSSDTGLHILPETAYYVNSTEFPGATHTPLNQYPAEYMTPSGQPQNEPIVLQVGSKSHGLGVSNYEGDTIVRKDTYIDKSIFRPNESGQVINVTENEKTFLLLSEREKQLTTTDENVTDRSGDSLKDVSNSVMITDSVRNVACSPATVDDKSSNMNPTEVSLMSRTTVPVDSSSDDTMVLCLDDPASSLGASETSAERAATVLVQLAESTLRRKYKCRFCDRGFNKQMYLNDHERQHLLGASHSCDVCGEAFYSLSDLNFHMQEHNEQEDEMDDELEELNAEPASVTSGKGGRKGGQKDGDSRPRPFKCGVCGKAYFERTNLRRHKRTHTGEKPYKCDVCGCAFALRNSLKAHLLTHTEERPFQCGICGKTFKSEWCLKNHFKTHTSERPYKCEICGMTFKYSTGLNQHRATHGEEMLFMCSVCGEGFNVQYKLTSHMIIHSGERPHKCETCGKAFKTKGSLNLHRKLHTGEKPHKCDICGYASPFIGRLNAHKATHATGRQWSCFCGKSFKNKKTLVMHQHRQHPGQMQFKCEACGDRFASVEDLSIHTAQHTNEVAHRCQVCDAPFKTLQLLHRHQKGHRPTNLYKSASVK
ncbi:uncharacterized protein LOC101845423 [Aplysia californica]|uniref:Uncharacterized protein LOC101845423 n=1 Tax=Aplysia californica TaxID=6500 RepID=A0ABM1A8M0_APLCA|nr:uncharacterized protein LOC101845423 [Aplysia californica]XP_012942926.1 uncharacterized protein LOC101845423 [Aplysia californica]